MLFTTCSEPSQGVRRGPWRPHLATIGTAGQSRTRSRTRDSAPGPRPGRLSGQSEDPEPPAQGCAESQSTPYALSPPLVWGGPRACSPFAAPLPAHHGTPAPQCGTCPPPTVFLPALSHPPLCFSVRRSQSRTYAPWNLYDPHNSRVRSITQELYVCHD
jgi:hypothetical protein